MPIKSYPLNPSYLFRASFLFIRYDIIRGLFALGAADLIDEVTPFHDAFFACVFCSEPSCFQLSVEFHTRLITTNYNPEKVKFLCIVIR
jgi:hypothetical protein